jgi:hypothetical protein
MKDLSDQLINLVKVHIKAHSNSLLISKIVLMVILYTFLIMNSLHDFVSPTHVPECIKDEMQDLTLPINEFLEENQFYKNALIIVSSFMIDLTAFMMTARFMIFERNFKLPLTMLAMYIFRGFLQNVFFMKFPTNYIWGSPGLFSVTVPYAPANDFFFSGHVGLCTICFIYFKRQKVRPMQYFAFVTIIVEFFTLLVTRAHYFIDLVIGIIVAHYIYLIGDWIQNYFHERKEKQIKEKQLEAETSTDSDELSRRLTIKNFSKSLHDELRALINGKSKSSTTACE